MFQGCGTALVTPFQKDLSFDEAAMRRLVQRQIRGGIDFLVPCGTTGESPTLTHEEHMRVVQVTLEEARAAEAKGAKKTPVVAGAGGYNTAEVIHLAKELKAMGVDGILSVTPYYNKPTQEGVYQHFKAIAAAVEIPMIVYSIQGRTGINVEPGTLKRLAAIDTIVGVKEASGNISQMAAVIQAVPDTFDVLCGDDSISIALIALGGRGVISVVSNEIPGEMTKLIHHALDGNFAAARELQARWFSLMEVNFIEPNPTPCKAAMAMMGLLEPVLRMPLLPASDAGKVKIENVLKASGLLPAARSTHAD